MLENRHKNALGAAVSALTLALGASSADGQPLSPTTGGKGGVTKPAPSAAPTLKPGGAAQAPTASKGSKAYDDESPKENRYGLPSPTDTRARPASPPGPGTTKADESPKENRYKVAPVAPATTRK